MDSKLKFWAIAIGFLLFLWFLSPEPEYQNADDIMEARLKDDGVRVADKTLSKEPMKFKTAKVPLTTRNGNLPLVLGFAHTREQQQAGLMHYRVWPKTMHGLLLLFREEEEYSMWMKDTFIPLDIAFIDRSGYIVGISENTVPESQRPIKAPEPILSVLELPAGSAKKWNLQKGDQLRLKYFRSALPAQ